MILAAILGFALLFWAFTAGFWHRRDIDKAAVFQGPIGGIANWIVALAGLGLVLWALF